MSETKAAVVSESSSLWLTPSIGNVFKPALLSWRQPRTYHPFLVRESPLSLSHIVGNCSINVDVFGRDKPEIRGRFGEFLSSLLFLSARSSISCFSERASGPDSQLPKMLAIWTVS